MKGRKGCRPSRAGAAPLHGIVAAGLSELKSSAGNALSVPAPPIRRRL